MELRTYQKKIVTKALQILKRERIVYIAAEVRTGKTISSLHVAKDFFIDKGTWGYVRYKVLFITKKKAIQSIKDDFKKSKLSGYFAFEVVSVDSVHKVDYKPDLVILDEAHEVGAFPKPPRRAKMIRKKFAGLPFILLSGTPSPESYAQLFHQFWCTGHGPWTQYKTFYKWARKYVRKEKVYVGQMFPVTYYGHMKNEKKVLDLFSTYRVSLTQKQAGFNGEVKEKIITIPLPQKCADKIYELQTQKISMGGFLVADTGPRLMNLCHQLCSGTFIDEDEVAHIHSKFKARYILEKYKGKKFAIFYLYVAEGEMLKRMFPRWTDEPEFFNKTGANVPFICQVTSGSMGTNLSKADVIIFFNIAYSAKQYFQARARSQTLDGGNKYVHWLFSNSGIEHEIYSYVQDKKNFTNKHFQLWLDKKKRKKGFRKF